MKHVKVLMALSLMLCNVGAYADYSCDPCDPCHEATSYECCDRGFTAYVDALYWTVCSGDTERETIGDVEISHQIDTSYEWGWRIGGVYERDNWDFGMRYTAYSSKTTEEFFLNNEDIDGLNSTFHLKYRVFDAELGYNCCLCEGFELRPFAGGKFASIFVDYHRLNYEDQEPVMDYDGRGLYLGFSSRWDLCHFDSCGYNIPLALVSRLSTGIMHSDFLQAGDFDDLDGDRYKECLFTPVHEVYLGLELGFDGLCDSEGFFQIGYEAQYWGWREYDDSDDITHLGMGGMVMRFGARF